MPGAPNKPPDVAPEPAAPPASPPAGADSVARARRVLRRLGPARVVLHLECWKGTPHADLMKPVTTAESLYRSGDFLNAELSLDQFAVRLAEPRWPTLPEPFRRLRVEIPAPQPPSWDPDAKLSPPEREAKKLRRFAENQLEIARASIERGGSMGLATEDLSPLVASARDALGADGPTDRFWEPIDRIWEAVEERVPLPSPTGPRPAPAAKLPPGIEPEEA